MTTKFKNAAGSTVLAIGLCTTGAAGADVLATSVINLTELLFTNDAGEAFVQGADIVVLDAANSSNSNTADLNGTAETITLASSVAGAPIDLPVTLGGGTANPVGNDLCVGGGCPQPNNEFEASLISSALGSPVVNQAYADQLLQGAAIGGIPGVAPGAQVASEASAQLVNDGRASAASENGLNATIDFIFSGTDATHFNVEFNAAAYLEAYRSSDLTPPDQASAFATNKVSFTLRNVTTGEDIFQWNPDGTAGITIGTEFSDPFDLNTQVSVSAFTPETDFSGAALGTADTGFFRAQSSAVLVNGNRYQLTAAEQTSVNVTQTQVPAPATLSILGLGLLGMGLVRRRKAVRHSAA